MPLLHVVRKVAISTPQDADPLREEIVDRERVRKSSVAQGGAVGVEDRVIAAGCGAGDGGQTGALQMVR